MKRKMLSYFSYGSLIIGAVIGVYVLADIYLLKSGLPSGVCPVTSNRLLLYSAIALCCISFILSLFEQKTEKKQDNN